MHLDVVDKSISLTISDNKKSKINRALFYLFFVTDRALFYLINTKLPFSPANSDVKHCLFNQLNLCPDGKT